MVAQAIPIERINVGGRTVRHQGFSVPSDLRAKLAGYSPKTGLGRIARDCFAYLPADLAGELLDHIARTLVIESSLTVRALRGGKRNPYAIEDYGVTSRKVITTTGVGFLVDAWQNLTEMENLKYHGIGTGSTAEASGDTALVTELTTQYNPDSTRATGSLTEGASGNIFRTVATNTVDASVTIAEHGVFSQAATGGGTLWDRSLTGSVALSSGDSLQSQYDMTASAGG